MPELLDRLQGELNAARKAQDKVLRLLLGTTISEAKNKEIELRRPLTDDDVVDVVRKAIKRRREAVEMYSSAGRTDLSEKEDAERVLLERYLPPAVDDAELRAAVQAAIAGGAANIGAVMGKVMPQFRGRVEGGTINAIAREELGRKS